MNWKFWKTKKNPIKVVKEVKRKIEKKRHEFPCSSDNCLVRAGCTKACDKLEMDDYKLKDLFMKYTCCPDCGSKEFYEGPSGGMSQNMECAGCGHWFNLALPMFVERIHINPDGRFCR